MAEGETIMPFREDATQYRLKIDRSGRPDNVQYKITIPKTILRSITDARFGQPVLSLQAVIDSKHVTLHAPYCGPLPLVRARRALREHIRSIAAHAEKESEIWYFDWDHERPQPKRNNANYWYIITFRYSDTMPMSLFMNKRTGQLYTYYHHVQVWSNDAPLLVLQNISEIGVDIHDR